MIKNKKNNNILQRTQAILEHKITYFLPKVHSSDEFG